MLNSSPKDGTWVEEVKNGENPAFRRWKLNAYWQQMKKGEPVIFWISGDPEPESAGVYASGYLHTDPYETEDGWFVEANVTNNFCSCCTWLK